MRRDRCGRLLGSLDLGEVKVVVREACEDDEDALVRFYEGLSSETVYTRFFTIIRYFQPYVERLLRKSRSVVVVAEAPGRGIIGVAEAVADDGDAEGGIAVLEEFQGRGVGRALATALLRLAAEAGFKRLYGYVMAGNYRAYRLARRFGARVAANYGDMILMEIPVAAGTGEGSDTRSHPARRGAAQSPGDTRASV